MTRKIKVYNATAMHDVEYDAEVMTAAEFEEIRNQEYTPTLVVADGIILYNEQTCHAGFVGTCNCRSHFRKAWRQYDPATGWGKIWR